MGDLSSIADHLESTEHFADGEESNDFCGCDSNNGPLFGIKVSEPGNTAVGIS